MKLSTRTRYGFRFMAYLASNEEEGKRIQIHKVAQQESISEKYLEQIVTNLKINRLVNVQRGPKGGYTLARPAEKITALEIMVALEGDCRLVECAGLLDDCERKSFCSMAQFWEAFSQNLEGFMAQWTLKDIVGSSGPKVTAGGDK